MRSTGRTALTALVPILAVLALGAVSAAPALASSLPEFGKLNSGNRKLTLTSSSEAKLETVTGFTFRCGSSSGTGELTGAKTATIAFKFTGCGVNRASCTTSGDNEGEITTPSLPAELVYLSKEKHEAGLVVNYQQTDLAAWECEAGSPGGIHGSIIVPISPVNTSTTSHTLDFVGKEGTQQPTSYENAEGKKASAAPTMLLFAGGYTEGSLTDAFTATTKEGLEVKA